MTFRWPMKFDEILGELRMMTPDEIEQAARAKTDWPWKALFLVGCVFGSVGLAFLAVGVAHLIGGGW